MPSRLMSFAKWIYNQTIGRVVRVFRNSPPTPPTVTQDIDTDLEVLVESIGEPRAPDLTPDIPSPIQSFDDQTKLNLLLALYPRGMDVHQLIQRIQGTVRDPEGLLSDLKATGLTRSDGSLYRLTNLGVTNVRNYLQVVLKSQGTARFYELIKPALALQDEWALSMYNRRMRNIIFDNYDLLHLLATEQSLPQVIKTISMLRKVPLNEQLVGRIEYLLRGLKSLDLVRVVEGDVDYLQITPTCQEILYKISGEMQQLFREGYEVSVPTPRILLDETSKVGKRFALLSIPFIGGAAVATMIFNLDLLMTCATILGAVVFLAIFFLYALIRI